jgi:hypothetical protein
MNQDGIWLPILEYANVKNISISTVRRGIKSGRFKYKEENGKYLIWTKADIAQKNLEIAFENELLKKENKQLLEEIADLKMLLSIYEKNEKEQKIDSWELLPPLPLEIEL